MKQKIINYLIANSGQIPEGETWHSIGIKFGIKPKDGKRAEKDKIYAYKFIARKASKYWQRYLKQQDRLKLTKQTYKDGELMIETFQKGPAEVPEIDNENFEIDRYTTNPYGGAWLKLKRKEKFLTDEHCEILKNIVLKDVVPFDIPIPSEVNNEGLFLYTSDKHIGALTKEDSIYTNRYDKEEMRRRIVLESIFLIEEKVRDGGPFESLYIMDLGDALDGFNQKTTGGLRGTSSHTLPQQYNNREQHDIYVELHKELFDIIALKKYAKNIYYLATSNSNHGGDFEYGAMRNLETYLNVKYPSIKTYVSFKPFNHFIYGNHAIIFGHGKDDEDMKHGLPLVLNPKVENYLNDYINVNKLHEYTILVVSGDLHQSAETYGKNFRYKKVLSQYGPSKWMHTNYGSGNPGLSIEILNKYNNKIIKEDIFFKPTNESNTGISF